MTKYIIDKFTLPFTSDFLNSVINTDVILKMFRLYNSILLDYSENRVCPKGIIVMVSNLLVYRKNKI